LSRPKVTIAAMKIMPTLKIPTSRGTAGAGGATVTVKEKVVV